MITLDRVLATIGCIQSVFVVNILLAYRSRFSRCAESLPSRVRNHDIAGVSFTGGFAWSLLLEWSWEPGSLRRLPGLKRKNAES